MWAAVKMFLANENVYGILYQASVTKGLAKLGMPKGAFVLVVRTEDRSSLFAMRNNPT